MIQLSRLNNEKFMVNAEMIEFVEETPDTVISLISGKKIVVSEPCQEVKRLIIEYKRQLLAPKYGKADRVYENQSDDRKGTQSPKSSRVYDRSHDKERRA